MDYEVIKKSSERARTATEDIYTILVDIVSSINQFDRDNSLEIDNQLINEINEIYMLRDVLSKEVAKLKKESNK